MGYLPFDILTAGIKSGRYIQGFLQVNKSNASQEAFLRRSRFVCCTAANPSPSKQNTMATNFIRGTSDYEGAGFGL